MQHSLYIAVARLVRYSQWAATSVFLACVYIAVSDSVFFEPVGRSLMIVVAALPASLFLVGLYFFESRQFRVHESRRQAAFSAAVFLVLAAPAIFLNWRFTFPLRDYLPYVLYGAAFIFGVTSLMPARAETTEDGLLKEMLLHYKHVMHDAWPLRHILIEGSGVLDADAISHINADRVPFYSQRVDDLLAFQETLTCPELDAIVVAEHLSVNIGKKRPLEIVDIGGGDGRFTAALLNCLEKRPCAVSSVVNIDPAPRVHDIYCDTLKKVASLRGSSIRCDAHGIEDAVPPLCDLLIASHSLYAVFDKARSPDGGDVGAELRKLLTHVRPGGSMVLVVSSGQSLAISAKRRIYHHVFGSHRFDTVAEDIDPFLSKHGWIEKRVQSDSIINLTSLLGDFQKRREVSRGFLSWASYFLRCDLSRMSRRHVTAIAEQFYSACFRLRELPESTQQAALGIPRFGLHLDSLVLLHKGVIYLLRTVPGK